MVTVKFDNCGILTKMGDSGTHTGALIPPVDGIDFPHSGLIKLFDTQRYGYVTIKENVTTNSDTSTAPATFNRNFNISMDDTTSSGYTTVFVKDGAVIRDGILVDVSAGTLTEISSGSPTDVQFIEQGSTGENFYHVIVVNSSNVIKIRNPGAKDKVADLLAGDIPIAILRVQNGETPTARHIQYLGSDKRNSGLSLYHTPSDFSEATCDINHTSGLSDGSTTSVRHITHDANANIVLGLRVTGTGIPAGSTIAAINNATCFTLSADPTATLTNTTLQFNGILTEMSKIEASPAGTTITVGADGGDFIIDNTDTDKKIVNRLGTDTTATAFEIRNNSDVAKFAVDGLGVTDIKSLKLGTAGELTVTESSDDITFANTVNDKTLVFSVKDDGGNARNATFTAVTDSNHLQLKGIEETFIIAASDETTDLTTGDGKATFAAPFNMLITGVKASVTTTPAGSNIEVAIRRIRSGTPAEVLSTNITIEPNEETSRTATNPPVINTSNDDINIDDIIAIDIDAVGSSRAGKGLKVTIFGYRT